MADPVIVNPTLTAAGQELALSSSNQGVSLNLTHVSFGTGKYAPTGKEVALKTPVSAKVTLAGGTRPTPTQLRMLAAWRENIGGGENGIPITEIGYWSNNILVFVWSTAAGKPAFVKTDGVAAVHFNDLVLSSVPAATITVQIDPKESEALAALAAHEGASNAHPDYVKHSLFPDAQADLWAETVGGSANAILLTMSSEIVLNAYRPGQQFRFKASYGNTGAVTININGLGVKQVVKSGGNALIPSDLKADSVYDVIYDGTRFQLNGGVGGGQFYIEYPTAATTAKQTAFKGVYTPGSVMVFVGGSKLPQNGFTAADGQNVTLTAASAAGIVVGTVVTIVALSTFAVADTYTKREYQDFASTAAQVKDKNTTAADRWVSPLRLHEGISARIQASLYDTTPGTLLIPGSFGAGATVLNATANINTLTASGSYGWGPSTVGRPANGESGEVVHLTGDTTDSASQLVTSHVSNRMWLRRKLKNEWASVELFHDGNQLVIGKTAESARTALELGDAALATLTTSESDTTIGRVLRVGDFGLGATDLVDVTTDLDALNATGFYMASNKAANVPPGTGAGKVIVMANAKNWVQQIFMPQSSPRMFQRACNGTTGARIWTPWVELWNGNNLVKTANNSDSTLGRMLQVGDFGTGSLDLATNNIVNNVDDVALPNGTYAVNSQTTGSKPNTWGILQVVGRKNQTGASARITQTFIETDAGFPREWKRAYKASTSSWSDWVEVWTGQNAQKALSTTDTTAGRLVRVGDYGLGAQLSVTDANDATVAGFYRLDTTYKNSPVANTPVWLLVQAYNNSVVQYASIAGIATADLWIRKKVGATGVWSAWTEIVKVGDFGLGAKTMAYEANIDDQSLANGWYAIGANTAGKKPASYGVLVVNGRNNFAGSFGRVMQTFYSTDGVPRVWNRTYTGTAADTAWSDWTESWTDRNLIKTENSLDSTSGRMLRTGDFGLGTGTSVLAPVITDVNEAVLTGFYRVQDPATNTPAGAGHGAMLIVSTWNKDTIQQQLLQGGAYWQRRYTGGKWGNWTQSWTSDNLEKTTSRDDTTAGRMLKVGDFGLGTTTINLVDKSIDDLSATGFYTATRSTTPGTWPSGATTCDVYSPLIIHIKAGDASQGQYMMDRDTNTTYYRGQASGKWKNWARVATSDDVLAALASVGFGISSINVSSSPTALGSNVDLNTLLTSGTYGQSLNANTSFDLNYPVLKAGTLFVQTGGGAITTQIYQEYNTSRIWSRARYNSSWSTWAFSWDSATLIKTDSRTDSTPGRMLQVGDFGLGGNAQPSGNANTISTSGFYYLQGTAANTPVKAFGLLVHANVDATGAAQTFFTTSGGRVFTRSLSTSGWSDWVESWHSGNLEKTASRDDTTAGRMLKVGDFGLGAGAISLEGRSVDDIPASGFYMGVRGKTPGTWPSGATTCDMYSPIIIHVVLDGASQGQYLMDRDGNATWYRGRASSSWKPWKRSATSDEVVDALTAVGMGIKGSANAIPSGSNLNNYVTSGSFGQALNAYASLDLNYPLAKAGTLFVQNGASGITTQMYQEFSNGRMWNRARYNSEWSPWSMCWDTDTLVKTNGDLDSTPGRMLKVGDYGLGILRPQKVAFTSESDWSKPAGWSGFIDLNGTKANGVTIPVSVAGTSPSYGMWQILGRRDAQDGYTGIFSDYGSGRMWIGYQSIGANPIIFKEIFSEISVSSFAQTLLDDNSQAAALQTLGVGTFVNGITTKNVAGNKTVTLSEAEANVGVLWFTGALTGNIDVIVPTGQNRWTVFNRTSGNYTLRLKNSGGVGQYIEQGYQADIVNDGTNLNFGANNFPYAQVNGELIVSSTDGLRLVDTNKKYGTIWRNDGATLYLLLTALGDAFGAWSAKRPLSVSLVSGMLSFSEGANVAAPPARDSSTRVPSSGWVQSEIDYNTRRFTGVGIGASGNYSVSANDTGRWINMTGVGSTATLPSSGSIGNGLVFTFRNQSSGVVKITHSGGTIQQETGVAGSTLNLQYNEWVEIASSGTNYWVIDRGKLEEVVSVSQLGDRVGEVTHFATPTPPAGYLVRDGSAVSRTAYKPLFEKIGTRFGAGDGSTTFNLPDSRGSFDRGFDDGRGLDVDRVFGSTQESANVEHTHRSTAAVNGSHTHTTTLIRERIESGRVASGGNAVMGDEVGDGYQSWTSSASGAHNHVITVYPSGEADGRPHNVAFLPCIKY
jgi:microcystin-dependent protein